MKFLEYQEYVISLERITVTCNYVGFTWRLAKDQVTSAHCHVLRDHCPASRNQRADHMIVVARSRTGVGFDCSKRCIPSQSIHFAVSKSNPGISLSSKWTMWNSRLEIYTETQGSWRARVSNRNSLPKACRLWEAVSVLQNSWEISSRRW